MNGDDQQELNFPAGFRFHPTDEELVLHYLCRRCAGENISAPIIADVDLYKFDPWQLPSRALYGEKEWYFFSPRNRKYPNGSRPNRSAGTGYWKATGADKPVGKPKALAIKKALVFYAGKAPKGVKTNWIMHEYRLANVDRSAGKRSNSRLDDWVLCRIYNKKGTMEKHFVSDVDHGREVEFSDSEEEEEVKLKVKDALAYNANNMFQRTEIMQATEDYYYTHFDTSESEGPLKFHYTDSSGCSDRVVSPEFREVRSEANKWGHKLDFQNNYLEPFQGFYDPFGQQIPCHYSDEISQLQGLFF